MILFRRLFFIAAISLGACLVASAQDDGTPELHLSDDNKKVQALVLHYEAVRARNKGDINEAEGKLRSAMAFDPNGAGLYYDMARINMERKQIGEAEENIKKAIKLAPENIYYKQQYAAMLMDANKFEKAAGVYEELLKVDEYNKEYLQITAFLYQRAGKKEKANEAYSRLLKMYGRDEEILEGQLQLHLSNNELDKAVEVNNLLIEIAPNESTHYVRLAEMYNNNEQPDKAAEVYRNAEAKFPDDARIQLSLSEYYKRKGDTANYITYLRKVVGNKSLDATEQLSIASGFILAAKDSADMKLAQEMLNGIYEANPDDPLVTAMYADMLGITGNTSKATEMYKKSLDIDPSNYNVWKNLLALYLQEMKIDSVIKYSEEALRKFPVQANLHYINGVGYNFKKDYNKAINALERAADMMPEENVGELAAVHSMLGDVYNSTKDYEQSDEQFEKALEIMPDNASTLNNYSYYLSERNVRLDDAEKMSKRSLELAPDQPTFLDTYGWIMYRKGNYQVAKEYIEKAIDAEPEESSATLWDHLGDIHFKLKNKPKALECWQKAKELGVDSPNIDKKIKEQQLYE